MLFVLSCASLFLSCTPKLPDVPSAVDLPESFSASGRQELPDPWWTAFADQDLDRLVEQALETNFTLKTAWQRLHEARAVVKREASFLLPDIEGFSEGAVGRGESSDSEQLRLGLASTYEVDLWGRIRSVVKAEQFRFKATYADDQTAALSLSAEVARTWYQLMESWNQLKLIDEQIETNEKVLSLLKARFGLGQIRSVDILRQQQLLEATREQQYTAQATIEVLEHQLAVLLGRPPQEEHVSTAEDLPQLPPLPATGLPAELVRRRPDVLRAYNLLQAADFEMAAAISNQFPRLDLTVLLSTGNEGAQQLFENWAASFAGNLLAPIFTAERLEAEVDRTQALKFQRLFDYGQTILVAFREVEDALIQEQKQKQQIQSLEEQIRLSRQAYEQLRIQYLNGLSGYIDVLTALTELQQLQRDLLTARRVLLEIRIALYRALAGGFDK